MNKARFTLLFAFAGALLLGAFMLVGTLFLGHVRPTWMEFDYAPRYAFFGLLVGSILGLILDKRKALASDRSKDT